MCKAEHEPGGPYRCAYDARNAAATARAAAEAARAAADAAEADLADARRTYQSEAAYRNALNAKIRSTARASGLTHDDLTRRFVLQQFTSRLNSLDPDRWVLAGGSALQYRSTEARPTTDADFAVALDQDEVLAALNAVAPRPPGGHGEFVVTPKASGDGMIKCKIVYLLDGNRYGAAGLDIDTRRRLALPPETLTPDPVINIDDAAPTVPTKIYPRSAHIADKVTAMYQLYGEQKDAPSTRTHDLADIVLISRSVPIDARELRQVIDAEQKRRGVSVPPHLPLPDEHAWRENFPNKAGGPNRPAVLETVDTARAAARAFLEPILDGSVTDGRWNPDRGAWEDSHR